MAIEVSCSSRFYRLRVGCMIRHYLKLITHSLLCISYEGRELHYSDIHSLKLTMMIHHINELNVCKYVCNRICTKTHENSNTLIFV